MKSDNNSGESFVEHAATSRKISELNEKTYSCYYTGSYIIQYFRTVGNIYKHIHFAFATILLSQHAQY